MTQNREIGHQIRHGDTCQRLCRQEPPEPSLLLVLLIFGILACREYIAARTQRWQEREIFRRDFRQRHPTMAVHYPIELLDLPPFSNWLTTKVKMLQGEGENVHLDIVQYSQPPQRFAIAHRQMYAFGMHLRVRSAEAGLVTRDSGVVASFSQQLRWGVRNGQPLEKTNEYVGYIEEILELDYRNHCTTILVCDWIQQS